MIYARFLFLFFFSFLSVNLYAAPIILGKKLPVLSIVDEGELFLDRFGIKQYKKWTSSSINQKKIIQYMPGRLSSKQNLDLNEASYAIDHPHRCRTISVINYYDAIPGTWIFIDPEVSRKKKMTPLCGIVLDKSALGIQSWNLQPQKNYTIVVNEKNIVEFFYEGKLSEKQILQILNLTNPPGIQLKTIPQKKMGLKN